MRERRARLIEVAQAALEAAPAVATAGPRMRRWCASWLGAGAALVLLALAVLLPGLWSIPPIDRDEARFATASRQMVLSGDWVLPRVQDKVRLNKPPLAYWLQAGVVRAAQGGEDPGRVRGPALEPSMGDGGIWLYRLPGALCALLSVLMTWRLGLRLMDARAAALGAALLAVCPLVVLDAHQARADQPLLLSVTGAMHAMAVLWTRWRRTTAGPRPRATAKDWGWALTMWAWVGVGVLAKGPVTPMVVALTAAAIAIVTRSPGWLLRLRPLAGALVVVAIAGPWVYAVVGRYDAVRAPGEPGYSSIVLRETLGRSGEAAEGHWGPPGYHLVLLVALLWPGSLVTGAALLTAWRRVFGPRRTPGGAPGRRRLYARATHGPWLFLLAWVVPSWIVFELVATKLPHYVMPLYPALALLSARLAVGVTGRARAAATAHAGRPGVFAWGLVGTLGLSGTLLALALLGGLKDLVGPESATGAGLSSAVMVWVFVLLACGSALRGRQVRALTLGITAAAAWSMITLGAVLPRCPAAWVSPRVAQDVESLLGNRTSPLALVGYDEDSLVYLLDAEPGRVRRVEPERVADWVRAHPRGAVVVDARRYPGAAIAAAATLDWGARVEGFNYSTGRRVTVEVYAPMAANPRLR